MQNYCNIRRCESAYTPENTDLLRNLEEKSQTMQLSVLENKTHVKALLDGIVDAGPGDLREALENAYHPDAHWRGSHPLNEIDGITAIEKMVWQPFIRSFPDIERRDSIIIGGSYENRDYVGMIGHYAGTFARDWINIPATGGLIYLRYGEFHRLKGNRIIESTVILDVLDVIRQAGIRPLPPSLGSEEMWPGPISADGCPSVETDEDESATSLKLCLAMQKTLDNTLVERDDLLNMSQKEYWHPKMMWYGPAGIGTGRGLQGFVDCHQRPFRIAFPKRYIGENHYVEIGDGKFAATAGWPSVMTTHVGDGWLGLPATGRKINMRVMDFYLCEEGLVRENWVPIDIIDILLQMGIDIMEKIRQ